MSTITREFTKEQLIAKLQHRLAVAATYPDVEEAELDAAIFKIALASLEVEAVAFRSKLKSPAAVGSERWDYTDHRQPDTFELENCVIERLFIVPPAPVSVPLAIHDEDFEKALSVLNDTLDDCGDSERGLLLALEEAGIEVRIDACRAAMLQGAEPVTTAYKLPFEQWLSQQTGTIDVECGCVMTEVFFNWLRVAYEAGNSPEIPDGWVACSERMPEGMTDVHISNGHDVGQGWWDGDTWQTQHDYYSVPGDVTHWQPIPKPPLK
ncbi:DUF551 domain-containing protein [Enterobacter cloacae complex sp. 2024EL-00215]|uniref:DUF551 domain-containing protein n=1 Tax=unclassified Enterobacter cloacae complex TaxID=2757714 RepID=UPI003751F734